MTTQLLIELSVKETMLSPKVMVPFMVQNSAYGCPPHEGKTGIRIVNGTGVPETTVP